MSSSLTGGNNLYAIPWGATPRPYKRKPRKRMSPEERLSAMVAKGRRPTLSNLRHELSLETDAAVLQVVLATPTVDIYTRSDRIKANGNRELIFEVGPIGEPHPDPLELREQAAREAAKQDIERIQAELSAARLKLEGSKP